MFWYKKMSERFFKRFILSVYTLCGALCNISSGQFLW